MKQIDLTTGKIKTKLWLFALLLMLYGYYRAVNKPVMSVILTVISLGIRTLLSIK